MNNTTKALIAVVGAIAAGSGGALLNSSKPDPKVDSNAWYFANTPSVWIESQSVVWISTPDLGTVNAGNLKDVRRNYPQFKDAIDTAYTKWWDSVPYWTKDANGYLTPDKSQPASKEMIFIK